MKYILISFTVFLLSCLQEPQQRGWLGEIDNTTWDLTFVGSNFTLKITTSEYEEHIKGVVKEYEYGFTLFPKNKGNYFFPIKGDLKNEVGYMVNITENGTVFYFDCCDQAGMSYKIKMKKKD